MEFDLKTLYFTSDWHYNHHTDEKRNIINYCNRPFDDLQEMNSQLVSRYNQVVSHSHTCIFVGDFFFYGMSRKKEDSINEMHQLLNKMNGTKVLVRGNHDWWPKYIYLECGFAECVKSLVVDGYRVVHRPQKAVNYSETKFIVGHVHEHWVSKDNMVNVGVDVWDFKPVHFAIVDMVRRFGKTWEVMGIKSG